MTSNIKISIEQLYNELILLERAGKDLYLHHKYGIKIVFLRRAIIKITNYLLVKDLANKVGGLAAVCWKNFRRNQITYFIFFIAFILTMFISCARPVSSFESDGKVVGVPIITDGDSIIIEGTRIRLHGIDAPEEKQLCIRDGVSWPCGKEATTALKKIISMNKIECLGKNKDRYKRLIAVCYFQKININAYMVKEGWALAYRRYSKDYVDQEREAKDNLRGIWSGDFIPPWDWRKR